jgi:hypothetical protein
VPTTVGGNTGPAIASDNNVGNCPNDIGAPRAGAGDGLAFLQERVDGKFRVRVYNAPTTVGGNTGPPIASDENIGGHVTYMTTGNFDGDPEDEWAIVRQRVDGKFKLHIYDAPATVGGNTGALIASDNKIGGNILDVAAANFDADPEEELVVLRLRSDGRGLVHIYDVPTTVGGDTGPPIASDNNVGLYAEFLAAGNFDTDPGSEIAIGRKRPDNKYKLHIYDAPTTVGGNTGAPIASDDSIGANIIGIHACEANIP